MAGENILFYSLFWSIILIVPVLSYIIWLKTYQTLKVILALPGPPIRSPLGVADGFILAVLRYGKSGFIKYSKALYEHYEGSKAVLFWISLRPAVAVFDQEVIEAILTSQDALEKQFPYTLLHPWLGTGLLTSSGNKWKSRRRLLTPTFHFRILEDFLHVFNEQSLVLVNKLKEHTGKAAIDVGPLIKSCTLDIICETAMGVSIGAQDNKCPEYTEALKQVAEQFFYRILRPWFWISFLYFLSPEGRRYKANLNILHSFTRQMIQKKKQIMLEQLEENDGGRKFRDQHSETDGNKNFEDDENIYTSVKKRKSFMDLLLHYHLKEGTLSEDDIGEEVDTFMFEGHDTTATGISWVLYNIGLHPHVQKKVHEELDTVFGQDTERSVTTDDLKELKYLECVLKESLRLYPSVPVTGRILEKDLKIPSLGLTIPKGMPVFFIMFFIHRNKKIFPEPEKFDPDRFLPENSKHIHPFAYIPFSAGSRNCIGQRFALMEEKVIVSWILRHYTIRAVDQPDDLSILPELVLRSVNGIWLEFRNRIKN